MPAMPETPRNASPMLASRTWAWGQEPLPATTAGSASGSWSAAKKAPTKAAGATNTVSPSRRSRRSIARKKIVPAQAMKETAAGRSVSGGGGSSEWRVAKAPR